MGVATGCGCKEVYRFPHIIYKLVREHAHLIHVHLH